MQYSAIVSIILSSKSYQTYLYKLSSLKCPMRWHFVCVKKCPNSFLSAGVNSYLYNYTLNSRPEWAACCFFFIFCLKYFLSRQRWADQIWFESRSCFDQMSDLLLSSSSLLKMRLFGRTCFSRGRLSESAPHPVSPSARGRKKRWFGAIECCLENCLVSTGRSEHKQLGMKSLARPPQWPDNNRSQMRSMIHGGVV